MKKTLFILVSIICILVIIKYPVQSSQQFQDIDPFNSLYQIEEVKFSELKITAWAKIKNKNSSEQHLENILTLLENEYNLSFHKQWEADNNHLSVRAVASLDTNYQNTSDKSRQLHISLVSIHDGTYLAISLEGLMLEDRRFQGEILEKIFRYFGARPEVNQTAIFYIPEFQSIDNQKEHIHYLFNRIDGIIIEGIKDETLVSYSGFTPHFQNSVKSRGEKINVNIASRYHNVDNRTYLYIGTPLIHGQY